MDLLDTIIDVGSQNGVPIDTKAIGLSINIDSSSLNTRTEREKQQEYDLVDSLIGEYVPDRDEEEPVMPEFSPKFSEVVQKRLVGMMTRTHAEAGAVFLDSLMKENLNGPDALERIGRVLRETLSDKLLQEDFVHSTIDITLLLAAEAVYAAYKKQTPSANLNAITAVAAAELPVALIDGGKIDESLVLHALAERIGKRIRAPFRTEK